MAYADLIGAINAALRDGDHIDDIDERIIAPAPLDRDQKAALWLYAFSSQNPRQQRRVVRQQLAIVGLS